MGMKAEQWRQIILSFESKKTYNNPFLDVSIWSVFTGPSGRRIRREAYWDGGNTYRIAFAPTEIGMWSYRLEAPEETGLSGVQGTIECIPYEGDLAIYQHGFLKVHPSGRYLTYADGTPFFWLGDTHWAFAFGERWDESNHPQMTSMFRGMADRRKEQGYNVYQTNLRSDSWKEHKSRYWKTDAADDVPDVAFYQNELDRRMQYLADLGFINALGFAWQAKWQATSRESRGKQPSKAGARSQSMWKKWTDMEHCRPHIIRMSVRLQITIMTNRGLILC